MKSNIKLLVTLLVCTRLIDCVPLDELSSPFLAPSSAILDEVDVSEANLIDSTPQFELKDQLTSGYDIDYRSAALADSIVASSASGETLSSSDFIDESDMLDGIVAQFAASLLNLIESSSVVNDNGIETASNNVETPSSSVQNNLPTRQPNSSATIVERPSSSEVVSSRRLPTLITAFRPSDLRLKPTPTSSSLVATPTLNDDIVSSLFEALLQQPTAAFDPIVSIKDDAFISVISVLQQSVSNVLRLPISSTITPSLASTLPTVPSTITPTISSALPVVSSRLSTSIASALPAISSSFKPSTVNELPSVSSSPKPSIVSESPFVSSTIEPLIFNELPTVLSSIKPSIFNELPIVSSSIKPSILNTLLIVSSLQRPPTSSALPEVASLLRPPTSSVLPAVASLLKTPTSSVLPAVANLLRPSISSPTPTDTSFLRSSISNALPAVSSLPTTISSLLPTAASVFKPVLSALPLISISTRPFILSTLASASSAQPETDALTLVKPSEFVNHAPSIRPTISSPLATSSSPIADYDQVQSQVDKVTQLLNIKDFSLTRSNVSDATVDRIIQGLMDIIRPLNFNNQNVLSGQSLSPKPTNNIQFPFLSLKSSTTYTPNLFTKSPSILGSIQPTKVVSEVFKTSIIPSDNFPVDNNLIAAFQAALSAQDHFIKTPILTNPTSSSEVITTGRQPPQTLLQHLSSLYGNPTPTLLPQMSSIHIPIQNFVRPLTSKKPIITKPPTTTTTKSTFVRLTPKPPISTTFEPELFSFGEARPIVLDLSDDKLEVDEHSRLPISQPTFNFSSPTFSIGSNSVQINVKPQPTNKPEIQHVNVINIASSSPIFDTPSTFEIGKPGGILIRPTLSSVWDGRPTIVPLRSSSVIQATPLLDRPLLTNSHIISTQSTVFIRPTPSSSSVHRQTIFHTIVTFSDSSQQNIANDDQPAFDGPTDNNTTTTIVTTTSTQPTTIITTAAATSTTSRRPVATIRTTTRRPAPTRRRRRTTTTTTTTTRRPFIRRRTTTTSTRRPIIRWPSRPTAQDDPPTATTTAKPARPGHNLMAFGLSLLPAAVIAAIIGFPLAIGAGRKRRDTEEDVSNEIYNEWKNIRRHIEEFPLKSQQKTTR